MTDPGSRRLGARYELAEILGYGGMAEVHRGRDIRLGRDVAIKTLRADLARDPAFQSRFRREAQSAASLNHPSVVAVYDTGEDTAPDGASVPYIVMEYVEGRTLRDVLHAEGRITPQRALEVTAEILGALEYSHRAGIIHRDIKPANVMLTRAGDVKVMDFGIARALTGATSTMTQTSAVVGTAQYLSPEQARGEHVDGRSDIYSTGCMLYELLTGRPPFVGDSPVAVAYQHVREDPVPPSRIDPDIPAAVDSIVLKAMAKNPANRYQSADEMRADVARALAGRPVEATPVLADAPTMYAQPVAQTTTMRRVDPDPDRDRRRAVAYVLLGLAVIGIFILAAILAKSLFSNTKSGSIATPNVIGKTTAQAQPLLTAKGLQLGKVTSVFASTECNQAKGLICQQSPVGGIFLNRNATVDVTVSKGTEQVQVPDLRNKSQADAVSALTDSKLKLGTVTKKDSTEKAGTVLEQTPTPGTAVATNSKVNIVVASGDAALPDVVNQPLSTAISTLQAAGFSVRSPANADQNALVTAMSPQGGNGRTAPEGSTVTLTIATATPTPTPSTTSPPPPPPP
jgi:serine/threonine-protein kinase